jgi:hypothetical protein
MSATLRRGACPGLSAPMQTGDGLLARLVPLDGLSPDAFSGFCAAARRDGNGTIEVTARGSLQVRGLTPETAPQFATTIAALDIPASDGVPVTADPLGASDPEATIDSAALAARLREAIATASLTLGPKVSVTLDSGGHLHLDALPADIRLRAIATVSGPRLAVAIGGAAASAAPLGTLRPRQPPPQRSACSASSRRTGAMRARGMCSAATGSTRSVVSPTSSIPCPHRCLLRAIPPSRSGGIPCGTVRSRSASRSHSAMPRRKHWRGSRRLPPRMASEPYVLRLAAPCC